MSAICPLKVQKLAKKRNNQFFVNCRKTALLCDFWNISKLCKMRGGIFDSRTGHHTLLLTFGFIQPFVSIFSWFPFWSLFGLYFGNLVFIVVFTQVVEICQLPAFSFGQIPKPLRLLGSFSPVPLGTYDSRYCSLSKLERILNLPIRQPHLRLH